MVSTRGVRYKFSEGERVLCYEPDPTKAKVLYDSKVLEVIESKDKRGRRTVEYLIHFQGWNSSWDRCVSEDFVLKDTEENRQLQRDLAEKSQLQLGAYLYRRERKKGSGSSSTAAGSGAGKRARHGFSDDGSSSSTQPDEGETVDTDSSSGDASGSQPQSPPPATPGRAQITLPSALRDRLTFDYHLVVKRGKLVRLPASPNASDILEQFVKWFARAGAWHPQRGRHDPPQRPDLTDVSCRLNLVREVADGLRVYFDFVLRGHLLYKQELNQYMEVCGQYVKKKEEEEAAVAAALTEYRESKLSAEIDIKSPKMPEYSHLPPDPSDTDKNGGTPHGSDFDILKAEEPKEEPSEKTASPPPPPLPPPPPPPAPKVEASTLEEAQAQGGAASTSTAPDCPAPPAAPAPTPAPPKTRETRISTRSSGNVARRLRSHKSAVSQGDDEPAPSTSAAEPRAFETLSSSLGSSGSSLSESWARPTQSAPATTTTSTRTPLSLLLDKVTRWQLIGKEENHNHLPCRVYGAIHLARLFVKLPDFLNATTMPDFKLKFVLKHIDMFIQFLDEHNEWFGEHFYFGDSTSRSH